MRVEKICRVCGEPKFKDELKRQKRKDGTWYYKPLCKECSNKRKKEWREKNRDYDLEQKRKWQEENSEKCKEYNLKSKTGWTILQKEQVYEKQNGECAICKLPFTLDELECDHRETPNGEKIPRALLCRRCNYALGAFESIVIPMYTRFQNYIDQYGKDYRSLTSIANGE